MSDQKPAEPVKSTSDIWRKVAADQIVMTAEAHGVSLLLISPSTLGKSFVRQDQVEIDKALANLKLSQSAMDAAQKLMKALKVDLGAVQNVANMLKGAYAGSEPHPDDTAAAAIIEKLQGLP